MKIEYHYAPMNGQICCKHNGNIIKTDGWSAHHELMEKFLNLRSSGKIIMINTVGYGHEHFNGHSGRVDIYEEI